MTERARTQEAPSDPDEPPAAGEAPPSPAPCALPAGLRYVTDTQPGIQRLKKGKGFAYRGPDGSWIRDEAVLARIRKLAIPPAYRDVWICPSPHGHLQATGRDARGRKQYRYHPDWRQERDQTKFDRMAAFGEALPVLRARAERDLKDDTAPVSLPRTKVLAILVRLLDTTLVRVGNEEYAKANKSYGLTTLRDQHATIKGGTLRLSFRGKSGVRHQVTVDNPRVARIVRQCQALPGHELFQYEEEDGTAHTIGSADVNDYLREITGEQFTAKDFRTWHASVHALDLLRKVRLGQWATEGSTNRQASLLLAVLREVAGRLGNTAAVCRKSYVHPQVLAMGLDWEHAAPDPKVRRSPWLSTEEELFLHFLEHLACDPCQGEPPA